MRAREAAAAGAVMVALAVAGCGDPEPATEGPPEPFEPLVLFDTIAAAVIVDADTIPLTVEVADNADRRAYGLMERPELSPGHGMIFVYPSEQPGSTPFWMYRTRVPLDIAFLDADGEIVSILAMDPCPSPNPDVCRRYAPGVAYRGALEVPQGWFAQQGVEEGDRVVPPPLELPAVP